MTNDQHIKDEAAKEYPDFEKNSSINDMTANELRRQLRFAFTHGYNTAVQHLNGDVLSLQEKVASMTIQLSTYRAALERIISETTGYNQLEMIDIAKQALSGDATPFPTDKNWEG